MSWSTRRPSGRTVVFSTTLLVVSTSFLDAHASVVTGLLKGQLAANTFLNSSPTTAQADANAELAAATGKPLKSAELNAAWSDMTFSNDPIALLDRDRPRPRQSGRVPHLEHLGHLRPRTDQPASRPGREGEALVMTQLAPAAPCAQSGTRPALESGGSVQAIRRLRRGGRPPGRDTRSRKRASSSVWSVPRVAERPRCSIWSPASIARRWARYRCRSPIRSPTPNGPRHPPRRGAAPPPPCSSRTPRSSRG